MDKLLPSIWSRQPFSSAGTSTASFWEKWFGFSGKENFQRFSITQTAELSPHRASSGSPSGKADSVYSSYHTSDTMDAHLAEEVHFMTRGKNPEARNKKSAETLSSALPPHPISHQISLAFWNKTLFCSLWCLKFWVNFSSLQDDIETLSYDLQSQLQSSLDYQNNSLEWKHGTFGTGLKT